MPFRSNSAPTIHALRELVAQEGQLIIARRTARIAHDDAEALLEEARRNERGLKRFLGLDRKRAAAAQELERRLEELVANERLIDDKLAAIERAKVTVTELEAQRAIDLREEAGEGGEALRTLEAAITETQLRLATYKRALERTCAAQEDVMNVLDVAGELAVRRSPSGRVGGFVGALFDPLEGGDVVGALVNSGASEMTIKGTLVNTGLTAEQTLAAVAGVLLDIGECHNDDLPGLASRLGSRDETTIASAAEVANAALATASKRMHEESMSLKSELEALEARRKSMLR